MDTAEARMRTLQNYKQAEPVRKSNFLQIRFVLSLLIFLLFLTMERKELNIMGVSAKQIYETVCENAKGFDFVLDFPYTLNVE